MFEVVLTQFHITVGPVGPQIYAVVISPMPNCNIRIEVLSFWLSFHIGSLTCGGRTIIVGKVELLFLLK